MYISNNINDFTNEGFINNVFIVTTDLSPDQPLLTIQNTLYLVKASI